MEQGNFWFAFSLTLFAGLSTGIGAAIAFFAKQTNKKLLSLSLGFSAGVMLYVALVEILQKSREYLQQELGDTTGNWVMIGSFFTGIAVIAIIDRLIPSSKNPHEPHKIEDMNSAKLNSNKRLMRMGVMSALAIGIHNFPEGIATFMAGLTNPSIAIPIAIAIAIHNIPEGIAVSIPVFYATGNRLKAFWLGFSSGLAEPVGALIGYGLITFFFDSISLAFTGVMFGAVAGIMVFISLDELLPTAEEYGEHHIAIYGLIGGMAVMAVSLVLFN